MVEILKPKEEDYDNLALETFAMVIKELGGPKKMIQYRQLTWLPSLMEACYAIVLSEKGKKTADEIAKILGITKETVRRILSADPEAVKKKIEGEERDISVHTAGGLAKLAWGKIKKS
ncbi:MAG: regulatory domain protein [Synergistetes bacterium]|nr:regulatory domain protein [Synergistota bacterium]